MESAVPRGMTFVNVDIRRIADRLWPLINFAAGRACSSDASDEADGNRSTAETPFTSINREGRRVDALTGASLFKARQSRPSTS